MIKQVVIKFKVHWALVKFTGWNNAMPCHDATISLLERPWCPHGCHWLMVAQKLPRHGASKKTLFPTGHYSWKQELRPIMLHSLCTNLRPIKTLPPTEFALFLHKFSTNNTMQFSKPIRAETTVHQVPGFCSEEIDRIAEQTFRRYTAESLPKRKGKGVAIVWFRNDLRVLDNEALLMAWVSSEAVLPVYCVDPRLFSTTRYFGFPKTGGTKLAVFFFNEFSSVICFLHVIDIFFC